MNLHPLQPEKIAAACDRVMSELVRLGLVETEEMRHQRQLAKRRAKYRAAKREAAKKDRRGK